MEEKKKKKLTNHVVIVTSDAIDAGVKKYNIKPWVLELIILLLCAVIGAMVGYFFYEEKSWLSAIEKSNTQLQVMQKLQQENLEVKNQWAAREKELTDNIRTLEEEVQILSNTLNQKVESEEQLKQELEAQSIPTRFPLNGLATSMEMKGQGDAPVAEIGTGKGVMVTATAAGTVLSVNDDVEYGHNVWVDHGNGYVTIYRYQGEPKVKFGDVIYLGTTLFIIDGENTSFGYQIMKDGKYIDPMEIMDIKG